MGNYGPNEGIGRFVGALDGFYQRAAARVMVVAVAADDRRRTERPRPPLPECAQWRESDVEICETDCPGTHAPEFTVGGMTF